jgi:hypothetical protein
MQILGHLGDGLRSSLETTVAALTAAGAEFRGRSRPGLQHRRPEQRLPIRPLKNPCGVRDREAGALRMIRAGLFAGEG